MKIPIPLFPLIKVIKLLVAMVMLPAKEHEYTDSNGNEEEPDTDEGSLNQTDETHITRLV